MTAGTYGIGGGGVPVYGGDSASSELSPGATLVMGGGIEWDEVSTPEAGRCHHKRDNGEFCQRWPKKGHLYCPLHKTADEALDFLDAALKEG